jgi:YebC/PmpR family DNA-binding regulatory protein
MSGHSKWHNIQARKGKQDAKRSNVFSKLSKAITVAASQGGGDSTTNFSLRLQLDKARVAGMPKDNIDRAIKKGTGVGADATQLSEVLYEAYGPAGVAIIVRGLTDNKNRASAEIKHLLSKNNGSLGAAGSVQWMFDLWGVIAIEKDKLNIDREEFDLKMIEAGADNIQDDEDEVLVLNKIENFQQVLNVVKELNLEISRSGLEWVAKDKITVDVENEEKLGRLFEALDEHDDVDDYFTNAA